VGSATGEGAPPVRSDGRVVLLTGQGYSDGIVANFLAARVPDLLTVVEDRPSRLQIARRRARRVGWIAVVGQVLFITTLQPALHRRGEGRRAAILAAASLDDTPRAPDHRVPSINDDRVIDLLTSLRPAMVVVHGTRIISSRVLDALECPVVNMHAGITPRYRGVHGGYWALAEGHPEWVGTTVHLVDPGIDTGGILAQATFEVTGEDSFATYPPLQLVAGLPLLGAQVDRVLSGVPPEPKPVGLAPGSGLYYHPTMWGYLWRLWRQGVR